jgi:AraC-like DNA-binding protein
LEDNAMLTVLWGRWREWTSAIIGADSVERIARAMLDTLDDFTEGVFMHGANSGSVHVHRALAFIAEQYTHPISLREVSREVGVSASRLAHLFRDQVGCTVLQMVHQVRIRRARVLLERSDLNCAQIAYEVGYSDQSYFTRMFRRLVGVSPLRYRVGE